MDIELVIKSVVGLVVILAILIMVFLLPMKLGSKKESPKTKHQKPKPDKPQEQKLTFEQIRSIIKNKNSSSEDLALAVDQLVKHYATITPKMGIRSHPDFDKYVEIMMYLVRHRNTNKDLILKLDKALTKNNPQYRAELNDTLTKALNSRGI